MTLSMKLAVLLLAVTTAPAFAQEADPTGLSCADFMVLEGDAKGEAAHAAIANSPRLGAMVGLDGISQVQLITLGCQADGTLTAVEAAEKQLDNQ